MHRRRRQIRNCIVTALFLLMFILFLTEVGVAENEKQGKVRNVSPEEAQELIQKNSKNPDFVLLDVRTEEEFKEGHLEGALNLDFYSPGFREELGKLDKKKMYLVYCRSGSRSMRALDTMKDLGFKMLYNLSGGITAWEEKGYTVVK